MEAEYVACSATVQEAVWLRRFLRNLEAPSQVEKLVKIYSDSMAALELAKDPKYHGQKKHIDLHYHNIRLLIK